MLTLYQSTCCGRKKRYGKLETVRRIIKDFGYVQAFYICPFCARFHLTTRGKETLINGQTVRLVWDDGSENVVRIPHTSEEQYQERRERQNESILRAD